MNANFKNILKNIYVKFKFYSFFLDWGETSDDIVLIMDKGYHKTHPGLVDRFKVIVGIYYLAKINNRPFKLYFNEPFDLSVYLVPNKVDWKIEKNKWSRNIFKTSVFTYDVKRAIPEFKNKHKSYHCYYYFGHNVLRELNIYNWMRQWHILFNELFTCSSYLQNLLDKNLPKDPYVAVHFRFVNALQNFESGYDNRLDELDKKRLVELCIEAILMIEKSENKRVCVFSDSSLFLSIAKEHGFYVLDGVDDIGHITFSKNNSVYDKTFVDFYAIADSDKVYAVHGNALYNSVFPQYAALVGGKDFIIYSIDSTWKGDRYEF